jgi:hypothetical protein
VFQCPFQAESFRIDFQIVLPAAPPLEMTYHIPRAKLEVLPDGSFNWRPEADQWAGGSHPEIRLERIPILYETLGRPAGFPDVDFQWRAAALTPDGLRLQAQSAWSRFRYIP